MTRTVWTANRTELVEALQKARIGEAAARAVLAEYETRREVRLARNREARAAAKAEGHTKAQAATRAAFHNLPPDPNAAYHRWVLEQALTDPRYRKEKKA